MREVDRWLATSRDRTAHMLMELVRVPTVTPREEDAFPVVAPWLRALGFETWVEPFHPALPDHPAFTPHSSTRAGRGGANLRARLPGPAGRGRTLFSVHLDVVPPREHYRDAFSPRSTGGFVYGRGACDTKGNLVMLIQALRFLREHGIPLARGIGVDLVAEEEIGGNGALSTILHGVDADEVVVLEPTGLELFRGHRGCLTFAIDVAGEAVHMGADRCGRNAIRAAARVVEALGELEAELLAEADDAAFSRWRRPVQVNVGRIEGGEWAGSVAARCRLEGNMGFLPPATVVGAMARLRRHLRGLDDAWCRDHHELRFEGLRTAAYLTPEDAAPVRELAAALERCGAGGGRVGAWNVSCDARLYAQVGGVPTVIFGAGKLTDAHSDHERLALEQLEHGVKVLVDFLTCPRTQPGPARRIGARERVEA